MDNQDRDRIQQRSGVLVQMWAPRTSSCFTSGTKKPNRSKDSRAYLQSRWRGQVAGAASMVDFAVALGMDFAQWCPLQ